MLRKVLKEVFIREFNYTEKVSFLKRARELMVQKNYPAGEELFYYCYFITLRERLRGFRIQGNEGYTRLLLVEETTQIEEAIKLYEERLEKARTSSTDSGGAAFIEALSQ